MAFDRLLSPFDLAGRTLRNRAVSTAHGEQWAAGGLLTDHHLDYYARRAEGGAGLIIAFGSAPVCPTAATANTVHLWNPANEPRLTEMARRVHDAGCLLMAQASHRGPRERPAELDAVLQAPSPPMGADKLAYGGTPRVLSDDDIQGIVADFGAAAARLERCGFDGVEITALGTHLIEQFWSPAFNRRTDRWGGSFENRLRFCEAVLRAVRETTSDAFILAFRMSVDPQTDLLGLGPEDMLEIAAHVDGLGLVDLFDVSGGSGVNTETHSGVVPTDTFPVMPYAARAKAWRQRLKAPVLMAGRVLNPTQGERALEEGACDLVAMTRAMIADPDVVAKARAGTPERIRPCIAINEGCRRVTLGRSLACSVNPAVADGRMEARPPSDGRLTVIGAGPGGLEAARVAAERGMTVTVWERAERPGGQMRDYALQADVPHLLDHLDWQLRELERLGVSLHLGREAPEPDGPVIRATGAETVLPPEAEGLSVAALTDVDLLRGAETGGRVVVYDAEGRQRGALTAARLAEAGAEVTFVFPGDAPCENLEAPNRPAIFRRLAAGGVRVMPHHALAPMRDGLPAFRDAWSDALLVPEVDAAVFAGYRRSVDGPGPGARIGCARAPRLMRNAVSEGTRAALSL